MLRIRLALLMLPLVLVLAPSAAEACSCVGGRPICQTFWESDAVFSGEVLGIDPIPNPSGEQFMAHRRVRFRVEQAWRGGIEGIVEVTTGAGGGDCGYRFEVGERYIVYAYARGGVLSTGICSRTRKLAQASEDLDYVKTALRPSATGRIFGIARYQRDVNASGPARSAAGYKVVLTDGRRTWTETTGTDGRFEFTAVAAGKYSVSLSTPDTEHAYGPRDVTLADPRGCAAADFFIVPDGRIAVRVVDAAGAPRANIRVELIDLEERSADRPLFARMSLQTDADGRVEFPQLHPKQYALSVNGTRPPSADAPYAASYFPGAPSIDGATAIVLGLGERLDLGDWALPDPLPEHRLTGQVVWPDGRPAAGARVTLFGAADGLWRNRNVDKGSATTDEAGRFTLTTHAGITYELRGYLNVGNPIVQWSTDRVPVTTESSAQPITLVLRPPPGRRTPR